MLVFFGVITAIIIVVGAITALAIYFSEDITGYIQAKTDQLKAMTELIRKETNRGHAE